MKKIIAVALSVLLVLALACTAVAAAVDVTGTWYISMYGMNIVLELNADGTYAMDMSATGVEEPENGTYAFDGANITMDPGGEAETVIPYDAETNSFSAEGMTITREPAAAFEAAPAVAITDIAQIAGNWKADMVVAFGMTLPVADAGMDLTVTVTGDNVVMNLDFLGEEKLDLTGEVKDGAVVCVVAATDTTSESIYTINLLEDGTAAASFDMLGETIIFYLSPVAE